jgi:hypothetical protein
LSVLYKVLLLIFLVFFMGGEGGGAKSVNQRIYKLINKYDRIDSL